MSMASPEESHSAPTLSAVAKLAGVSSITVSRVVRLPDLVAPETRGRVEAAMRELGYVPNQLAVGLARARTRSIGVLVPTIANSIFADTVQGLSDELEPLGYAVILAQSRYDLGLSSIVELSQAQLNKTQAELEQASAKYEYQIASARLLYTTGARK